MAEASVPVDLFNPGQVFACLGFLEASDVLLGGAEGGFDWGDEANVRFCLRADGAENPFEVVLEFLTGAEAKAVAPEGWRPKDDPDKKEEPKSHEGKKKLERKRAKLERELSEQKKSKEEFPSVSPDTSSAMPIQIVNDAKQIVLGHWADGSGRNDFKLYSGNRPAYRIASAMLRGDSEKKTKGIVQLWAERRNDLIERPFDVTHAYGRQLQF